MSNIKAGELARLKVSGEDVFVLAINDKFETVEVRRPTAGQNGVFHMTETFTLAELETPSESRSRIAAEQMELRNLFSKTESSGTAPLQ